MVMFFLGYAAAGIAVDVAVTMYRDWKFKRRIGQPDSDFPDAVLLFACVVAWPIVLAGLFAVLARNAALGGVRKAGDFLWRKLNGAEGEEE